MVTHLALLLLFPPLMLGVIGRVKAWLGGRRGPPILQPYLDLWKLLHKGAVYSSTTTWVFRAGPVVSLAGALTAGLLIPLASGSGPLTFAGDVVAFALLLGLGRFFTMAAALDTGSSFEGMGASREAAFAGLTEPALFLALAIVCLPAKSASFEVVWRALPWETWGATHPQLLIAALVLFVVLLAECSRIPIDDPATHLELTMVHEVMVLDHGGPDLALVQYGGAIKLFVTAALLVRLLLPIPEAGGVGAVAAFAAGQLVVAALVGVLESSMARVRLPRVPQLLIGATVIATVGLAVLLYRRVG